MARTSAQILTPTELLPRHVREQNNNFFRLLPRLRYGKISFEVFSKRNLKKFELLQGGGEEGGHAPTQAAEDQIKEATEVRVRSPREKRSGSQERRQKPRQKGKGVQTSADTSQAVERARARKTKKVTKPEG